VKSEVRRSLREGIFDVEEMMMMIPSIRRPIRRSRSSLDLQAVKACIDEFPMYFLLVLVAL
jgi:hypothetical protein